jgi:hypothetical protein
LLSQFPLNANGKFDRGALRRKLEETPRTQSEKVERTALSFPS